MSDMDQQRKLRAIIEATLLRAKRCNFKSLRQSVERMPVDYRGKRGNLPEPMRYPGKRLPHSASPPASNFFIWSDRQLAKIVEGSKKRRASGPPLQNGGRFRFGSRSGSGGGYTQRSRHHSDDACASCCKYCGVKAQAAARFATDCLVFGGARLPTKPSRNSAGFAQDSTHACPTG
jgi:hypothetical protein